VLPHPKDGVVEEIDKFVRVGVEGASCNIAGFYIDIDVFSPGMYSRTSDILTPELNILVINHRTSMISDLLESMRDFEPKEHRKNLRPLLDEALVGTSLQPMFAFVLVGSYSC